MKNINSKFVDDFKTIGCVSKHENLVYKLNKQENSIFPGFLKKRACQRFLYDQYDVNINKSEKLIHSYKRIDGNNKPISTSDIDYGNSLLQGVLRTRKSKMKKIKLKQFYLSYLQEGEQQESRQISKNQPKLIGQNGNTINAIKQRESLFFHNYQPTIKRNRNLPLKLRAKSYNNFTNKIRSRFQYSYSDQNQLYIRPRCDISIDQNTQKTTIQSQQNLQSKKHRRTCRSRKLIKVQSNQSESTVALGDVSSRLNKFCMNLPSQNQEKQKTKRVNRNFRKPKNRSIPKLDCNFDLNPWNNTNNQEEKQNTFFIS